MGVEYSFNRAFGIRMDMDRNGADVKAFINYFKGEEIDLSLYEELSNDSASENLGYYLDEFLDAWDSWKDKPKGLTYTYFGDLMGSGPTAVVLGYYDWGSSGNLFDGDIPLEEVGNVFGSVDRSQPPEQELYEAIHSLNVDLFNYGMGFKNITWWNGMLIS